MRLAIAHPCFGSSETVFRINKSSVPCTRSVGFPICLDYLQYTTPDRRSIPEFVGEVTDSFCREWLNHGLLSISTLGRDGRHRHHHRPIGDVPGHAGSNQCRPASEAVTHTSSGQC